MLSDFHAALKKSYGDDPPPMERQHLEVALSTRDRGRRALDEATRRLGIEITGRKVLDVGCAYAGFVVEAAARGAEAWGVEINRKLWEWGRLNARGEPGHIELVPGDFLSCRVTEVLPDDFDLVILSDVFEHVYDTAALLAQLSRVMADGASFTFTIPNGDALVSVAREGHYGKPGLTLLPPNWWPSIISSFTAFYRPWSYYTALFRAFGFNRIARWNPPARLSLETAREAIAGKLARAEQAIDAIEYRDRKGRAPMVAALAEYRRRLALDLERGDLELLGWKYLTDFWRGAATRSGPIIADVSEYAPVKRSARDRFEPVALDGPSSRLRTPWTLRATSEIEHRGDGLRCRVTGAGDRSAGQYGGLSLPVDAPGSIRLSLELLEPENIMAVYVDGENPQRCRVMRWVWTEPGATATTPKTFELVPGKSASPLEVETSIYPQLCSHLHVFIRVRPGARAGFIVHAVDVR